MIEAVTRVDRGLYFRHPAVVRITHWVNVICLAVLLMSGLQIFNAHPQLDWGKDTNFEGSELLSFGAGTVEGQDVGVTTILGHQFKTTGVFGLSTNNGELEARAFPSWATLPTNRNLAAGRRWHFFFAWILLLNGVAYLGYGFLSRHTWRDLWPSAGELKELPRSIFNHLRLHFPTGEDAKTYNVLQKLSYLTVIFAILPLLILAGLTLSPALNAAFPNVLEFFGGRQSARTVHFLAATALLAFLIVHVAMVLVSGVFNNMRSMITGWYAVAPETKNGE